MNLREYTEELIHFNRSKRRRRAHLLCDNRSCEFVLVTVIVKFEMTEIRDRIILSSAKSPGIMNIAMFGKYSWKCLELKVVYE